MENDQMKKLITRLVMTIIFFGLITPVMGIDQPVEPFQKARAMALTDGKVIESENDGKRYVLLIKEWGAIIYYASRESVMLVKGPPGDSSSVSYDGKNGQYSVSQVKQGGKPGVTIVDWPEAMDVANEYLREIEAVRGK